MLDGVGVWGPQAREKKKEEKGDKKYEGRDGKFKQGDQEN